MSNKENEEELTDSTLEHNQQLATEEVMSEDFNVVYQDDLDIDLYELMDVCDDIPDLTTTINGERNNINDENENNIVPMEIEMEVLSEQISNQL